MDYNYVALVSFATNKKVVSKGELLKLTDNTIIQDLLNVGYIEEKEKYIMNYYKNDIRHIKGDTFSCAFIVDNLDQDIETAKFTCRDSLNDNSNVLFQKTLNDGITLVETDTQNNVKKYAVRVAPDDTKDLQSGTYYYDLEIGVNGDIFTLMKGRFIIEQDSSR